MTDSDLPVVLNSDRTVTLTLQDPGSPALVLSGKLLDRLSAALDKIEQMEDVRGLILTSGCSRVFIAGANLKEIDSLSDSELESYLARGSHEFARLAKLPYPTVASIDGAALGGGLEIAMHCDGLIGLRTEKPYPVGLPEAGLAICPGWGGTQLLPARINPVDALRQTVSGKPMKFNDAAETGLFDAVADNKDELITKAHEYINNAANSERAKERIKHAVPCCINRCNRSETEAAVNELIDELQQTDPGKAIVKAVLTGLSEGFDAGVAAERAALIELRNKPEAKKRLEAFFNKGK